MRIGLIGLGKMGSNTAAKFANSGHEVVVTDKSTEAIDNVRNIDGIEAAYSIEDLLSKLDQKIIWLIVPSKDSGSEIKKLVNSLEPESIIVDAGNSDFRLTLERAKLAESKRINLVDLGISGGEDGFTYGFSIMAGGPNKAFLEIEPLVQLLAHENGYSHFGRTGSGHFVKMVHNGIQYGIMESYAEGYDLLKNSGEFDSIDIAKVSNIWQNGSLVESYLNSLAEKFLSSDPHLSDVEGKISDVGHTEWTLELAKDKKILAPAIQSAFDRRVASQKGDISYATKFLAKLREEFDGHSEKENQQTKEE